MAQINVKTSLRIWHQLTIAEYESTYGPLTPLTEEEVAVLVVAVRCEMKGCDTVYSTESGTRWPQQALISHMWGRHGIRIAPRARSQRPLS